MRRGNFGNQYNLIRKLTSSRQLTNLSAACAMHCFQTHCYTYKGVVYRYFLRSVYTKTIIDSVFVTSGIMKAFGGVSGAPNGSVPQNICSSGTFLLAGRCGRNNSP